MIRNLLLGGGGVDIVIEPKKIRHFAQVIHKKPRSFRRNRFHFRMMSTNLTPREISSSQIFLCELSLPVEFDFVCTRIKISLGQGLPFESKYRKHCGRVFFERGFCP